MNNSIQLLKHSIFDTVRMEIGASGLFPISPLGTSGLLLDRVAQILDGVTKASKSKLAYYAKIYAQYLIDLPDLIENAKIEEGSYEVIDCSGFVSTLSPSLSEDQFEKEMKTGIDECFISTKKTFHLKKIHVSMLKVAHFRLQEGYGYSYMEPGEEIDKLSEHLVSSYTKLEKKDFGLYMQPVVAVDSKRPYGDRTYYYWDLEDFKVPDIVADGDMDKSLNRRLFSDERIDEIDILHEETTLALQALALYSEF